MKYRIFARKCATRNGMSLIKPSKKSHKKITDKLHEAILSNKSASQCRLIEILNPIITGWGNYFWYTVSKEVFTKIDHLLVGQLKRRVFWCHYNKSKGWILDKFFKAEYNRNGFFKDIVEQKEFMME